MSLKEFLKTIGIAFAVTLVVSVGVIAGVNELQLDSNGVINTPVYVKETTTTVGNLIACTVGEDKATAIVTDNLASPVIGANPAGGGTNGAEVRCDGTHTQWVIQRAIASAFIAPSPTPTPTPAPQLLPLFATANHSSATTLTMTLNAGTRDLDFVICNIVWASTISAPVYNATLGFNSIIGSLSTFNTSMKTDQIYYRWHSGNSLAPVISWTTASTAAAVCASVPNIPLTTPSFPSSDYPFDSVPPVLANASAATSGNQQMSQNEGTNEFALYFWGAGSNTTFGSTLTGGFANNVLASSGNLANANGSLAVGYNTAIGTITGTNIPNSITTIGLSPNAATMAWATVLVQNQQVGNIPYTVPAFPNFTGNGLQTFSVGSHTYNGHLYTVHGDTTAAGVGTDDTAALNDALIAGDVQFVPSTNACANLPGGHCGYKIVGISANANAQGGKNTAAWFTVVVPGNRQLRGNTDGSQCSLAPGNCATLINPMVQNTNNASITLDITNTGGIYTGSNVNIYGLNFRGINISIPAAGAQIDNGSTQSEDQYSVYVEGASSTPLTNVIIEGNDFSSSYAQAGLEVYGGTNAHAPQVNASYNSGANDGLYCLVFDNAAANSLMTFNSCTDASMGSEEDSSSQTPHGLYDHNTLTSDCNARINPTGGATLYQNAVTFAGDGVCFAHGANCSNESFTNNFVTGFLGAACGNCGTGSGGNTIQCSILQTDQDTNTANRPFYGVNTCTNGCQSG